MAEEVIYLVGLRGRLYSPFCSLLSTVPYAGTPLCIYITGEKYRPHNPWDREKARSYVDASSSIHPDLSTSFLGILLVDVLVLEQSIRKLDPWEARPFVEVFYWSSDADKHGSRVPTLLFLNRAPNPSTNSTEANPRAPKPPPSTPGPTPAPSPPHHSSSHRT